MNETDFVPFPKIKRYFASRLIITEKIDGSNAQVRIGNDGTVRAASRNRYITPDKDNFGFASWVAEHEDELRDGLGPGIHFGEWWGCGIQRRYGLNEKRFSLFNVGRWTEIPPVEGTAESKTLAPVCCRVVPVMYDGPFEDTAVRDALSRLSMVGSIASPGFMFPEGIVALHTASGTLFKATLGTDGHKGT